MNHLDEAAVKESVQFNPLLKCFSSVFRSASTVQAGQHLSQRTGCGTDTRKQRSIAAFQLKHKFTKTKLFKLIKCGKGTFFLSLKLFLRVCVYKG